MFCILGLYLQDAQYVYDMYRPAMPGSTARSFCQPKPCLGKQNLAGALLGVHFLSCTSAAFSQSCWSTLLISTTDLSFNIPSSFSLFRYISSKCYSSNNFKYIDVGKNMNRSTVFSGLSMSHGRLDGLKKWISTYVPLFRQNAQYIQYQFWTYR